MGELRPRRVTPATTLLGDYQKNIDVFCCKMRSRQSTDAAHSSISHLTTVNVTIKWWPELPFEAGVTLRGRSYPSGPEFPHFTVLYSGQADLYMNHLNQEAKIYCSSDSFVYIKEF
jgi:hypothetical protein